MFMPKQHRNINSVEALVAGRNLKFQISVTKKKKTGLSILCLVFTFFFCAN